MMLPKSLPLIMERQIPRWALGTSQAIAGNYSVVEAISRALAVGYWHFDTTLQYRIEKYIG